MVRWKGLSVGWRKADPVKILSQHQFRIRLRSVGGRPSVSGPRTGNNAPLSSRFEGYLSLPEAAIRSYPRNSAPEPNQERRDQSAEARRLGWPPRGWGQLQAFRIPPYVEHRVADRLRRIVWIRLAAGGRTEQSSLGWRRRQSSAEGHGADCSRPQLSLDRKRSRH